MDPTILLLPLIAGFLLLLLWRLVSRRATSRTGDQENNRPEKTAPSNPYRDIEPLHNFDWRTTPPLKIRPFKPKYHLTMALENCPLSELIENDDTYLERIQLRKQLMNAHPRETYQCNRVCEAAVLELYEWMMGTYLPGRFPTMFRVVSAEKGALSEGEAAGQWLYNVAADKCVPLHAASGEEALYTLGANVDTDMLLLLPCPTSAEDGSSPIYHLQAYVTCFPSGFATQDKLGLPLAGIHKPVPGYEAKLEKAMDRFFAKLECGRAVRRCNWSVTTNGLLYSQGGNHMYEDGGTEAHASPDQQPSAGNAKTMDPSAADLDHVIAEQKKDVDVSQCRLRCERQTLHRLPNTKALVFMFKTYQYRLEDVKAEGDGMAEALAEAIPGLRAGSVPDMAFYKRQVVWGDAVVEFLRS